VVRVAEEVERALPFDLLGLDCDNGSEFLNWHLLAYFGKRDKQAGFTPSRPYTKMTMGMYRTKELDTSAPDTSRTQSLGSSTPNQYGFETHPSRGTPFQSPNGLLASRLY
jgi:hypothetical protein